MRMTNRKRISKKERLQTLRRVIEERNIGNQIELQKELKKMGIAVTQATVSRDLQELGMVKMSVSPGVHKYKFIDIPQKKYNREQLQHIFRDFVKEIVSSSNMLLVKTALGNANTVAVAIDQSDFKEILGTIAGDDTILVVLDNPKNRSKVESEFRSLVG